MTLAILIGSISTLKQAEMKGLDNDHRNDYYDI